ncbi:hypothetical protein ACIGKL_04980 [Pseudomonas sp. NPDC077186]|uniref:hypothetical protein n=1 Tax=Pseudomonas sp. NPDC077186 TaxID=3364421 RepID=UPI0037CC85ED
MNINITAIERYIRLFGLPAFLMILGLVGMAFFSSKAPATDIASAVFASVVRLLFPASAGLTIAAALWLAWNCWQLHRWECGDLQGGCDRCGGVMSHKDGRYGAYSVCKMCGGKREGWH